MSMRAALVRLCTLFLLCIVTGVQAHDARPLTITMVEQGPDVFRVTLRAPPTLEAQNTPTLQWPDSCHLLESAALSSGLGSSSLVSCANGIAGALLELRYPTFNPSLTTLVRIAFLDGQAVTEVLPPDLTRWSVAAQPGLRQIAVQYIVLGFQHILEGLDHLLFVAGLLLLARNMPKIILAITGFTLAHSLTLALATFELVQLRIDLVEALIALSVVFLAAEVVRNDAGTFSQRYPVLLSFVFGLLHGFGFAAVLNEVSLPTSAVVQGLLFFNVGVELGQLAFIAVCLLLWQGLAQLRTRVAPSAPHLQDLVLLRGGAYFIGIPAAYWFVARTLVLFPT
jgi:hypothetical protein